MTIRIPATISAVSDQGVSFGLEGDQALMVPKTEFATLPQVGDTFSVLIMPEAEARLAQDDLARTILSQLIPNVPAQEITHSEAESRA